MSDSNISMSFRDPKWVIFGEFPNKSWFHCNEIATRLRWFSLTLNHGCPNGPNPESDLTKNGNQFISTDVAYSIVFQLWNEFLAPRSDDPWTIPFPRNILVRFNFVCSTNAYVTQVCISAHGDEWLVLFELQITECGRHKIILIWN